MLRALVNSKAIPRERKPASVARRAPAFEQPLPGVILDARRVAFFSEHELLVAADLHLGYAWCHRASGQLMPIAPAEDTLARLRALIVESAAKRVVLLGDIVHRALPIPTLMDQLRDLAELARETELILLVGNHDKRLHKLESGLVLRREYRAGENLFLHGDSLPSARADRFIIGHEHPGISLGDGVTTARKYPCFLVAEKLLVMPAFSNWSANSSAPHGDLMSPLARGMRMREAVAILGEKLLRVPLPR
jgi:uncharacterized protein